MPTELGKIIDISILPTYGEVLMCYIHSISVKFNILTLDCSILLNMRTETRKYIERLEITTLRDYREFIELTLYYLNVEHNALFEFKNP